MKYFPSNFVVESLRSIFKRRVGDAIPAYLGDTHGTGARVDVPGKPGFVYVHFPSGKDASGFALYSPPTIARSGQAAYLNYPGAGVYVGYGYDGELEIKGAQYRFLDQAGINTSTLNPLNQQSKWVYPWQITYGLALAVANSVTTSTLIAVKKLRYYVANTFTGFETPLQADKIDLAAYIPVADQHCYACVWIDTYTNTAVATTSVAQAMTTPLDDTDIQELIVRAASSRPPDAIPLKAFYLANDQASITQSALDVDLRQFLDNPQVWGFPRLLATLERVRPDYVFLSGRYAATGVGAMAVEAGGLHTIVPHTNLDATTDPTVNDDEDDGYSPGSWWVNNTAGTIWFNVDATAGAAVWKDVTASGTGTVTSVGLTMPTGVFDVAGSPVTGTGTFAVTFDTQTANTGFYGPSSGSPAAPTFRAMVTDDIGQIIEFDNLTTNMREISANVPTVLDDGPDGKLWQRNASGFEGWWILDHHDTFGTPIWYRIGRVISASNTTNFFTVTNQSSGNVLFSPLLAQPAGLVVATPGASTGQVELQALTTDHLPTVNSNVGSFTNASVTVTAKGLITAVSSGAAPVTSVGATSPIASSGGATPTISLNDTAVSPGSYIYGAFTVDQKGRLTAASNGIAPNTIAIFRDEKTSGTAGGTSTSTTWNARDLNTELYDPGGIVSISSSQFTPIAGDYEIQVFAPFLGGAAAASTSRCRLYNVTGAASVEEGINITAAVNGGAVAILDCKFTANGTDAYRIDSYTTAGRATDGLGRAASDGSAEAYTTVYLRKVA